MEKNEDGTEERRLGEHGIYESLRLFLLKAGSCSGLKQKVTAGRSSSSFSSSIIKHLYRMQEGRDGCSSSSSFPPFCPQSFFTRQRGGREEPLSLLLFLLYSLQFRMQRTAMTKPAEEGGLLLFFFPAQPVMCYDA